MTEKRFINKESVLTDGFVIVDTLKQYTFPVLEATDNYSIMKALNELADENGELKSELEPIRKICKKYRIPIKDLPEILEEYIAYDNDDNW